MALQSNVDQRFASSIDRKDISKIAIAAAFLAGVMAFANTQIGLNVGGGTLIIFAAAVGGFEYTIFGLADGLYDLGLLLEYHNDSRGRPTRVQFQNDLFLATRFGFTDTESSEILAGMFLDLDDQSQAFRVEANRRVLGDARVYVEAQVFSNMDPDNVGYHLRNSDFVRLSLELYF